MSWTFHIVDTRTGDVQVPVEPSNPGRFGHRLAGNASDATTTFQLTDDSVLNDSALTRPWARTLVASWNGVAKYAGLIESDTFDDDTQTLTLNHVDIESFLSTSRYPFGTSSYWADEPNHIPGSVVISGKSKRAAIAKLIEQSLLGPDPIYSLPIVLPSLSEAGSFSKTYENYNFETIGDHLEDFRALGLDIELEPRWSTAGKLEWLGRIGSDAEPSLVGDVFEFNQTEAAERRLKNVKYTRDGRMQLTGQFGVGQGSEVLMRVGGDGIGSGATIPARDRVEFYKNETSESILAAYGLAAVEANEQPTYQWEMSLLATEEPGFENIRLGSILRMFWEGSRRIPDGSHDVRVIGWTANANNEIVIDAQTWG